MAEAVPHTHLTAPTFDPAHDFPPADNASETFSHSSNVSTQLKFGSDTALIVEPVGDVPNEKATSENQAEQVRRITGVKWVLLVLSILSSTFLFALDNTIVAVIQSKIVERFGEIQKLPWLSIAFLVACVSTNLIW